MTDPITCPECQGRRGHLVGTAFLACQFCGGLGWVGGDNEPAERSEQPPPPPPPAWEHKVWADPMVNATLQCRYCLGARAVAHIEEEHGTLQMVSCPACVGSV